MSKLLTFLGPTEYSETVYIFEDNEKKEKRNFYFQEALIDYLKKNKGLPEVILFLTEASKEANWNRRDEKYISRKYPSLKEILDEHQIIYHVVDILSGTNEKEIWDNFKIIYQALDQLVAEGEDIYLDVTYSFRSLPILFLSLMNYIMIFKKVKINGIYYGAYELKDNQKQHSPVLDLTAYMEMNQWSFAVKSFLSSGDTSQLTKLFNKVLAPLLKEYKGKNKNINQLRRINDTLEDYTKALRASRGIQISELGYQLKIELSELQEIEHMKIKHIKGLLATILERISFYTREDIVYNLYHSIAVCKQLNLIQQAYTLLHENILNYILIKVCGETEKNQYEILEDANKNNYLINDGKKTSSRNIVKGILKNKKIEGNKELRDLYKKVISLTNMQECKDLYRKISIVRNDINHAGYQREAFSYQELKDKLGQFIKQEGYLIKQKR